MIFLFKKRDKFLINSEIHHISTRHSFDLYLPMTNLDIYQKGVYYSGIKIFNSFPFNIRAFSDNRGHLRVL